MSWNLGAWLGTQLGGTAWMAVAGALALSESRDAGAVVLMLFAAANVIGVVIWRNRNRFSAHAGLQILLPVLGNVGLAATYVLDRAGIFERIQTGPPISATEMYVAITCIVAALMLLFYFRFGRR